MKGVSRLASLAARIRRTRRPTEDHRPRRLSKRWTPQQTLAQSIEKVKARGPRAAVRRHMVFMVGLSDRLLATYTDGGPSIQTVDRRKGRAAKRARRHNRRR